MDIIPQTRTIMFVGDYFTLMTTIVLDDNLKEPNEDDKDFAVRLASTFIKGHYGFDVEAVSNDIGIVDDNGDEVEYE
jgi:hypothetical protein